MTHALCRGDGLIKNELLIRALQTMEGRRVDAIRQIEPYRAKRRVVGDSESNGVNHVIEVFETILVHAETEIAKAPKDIPEIMKNAKNASSMKANPIVLTDAELTEILQRAL